MCHKECLWLLENKECWHWASASWFWASALGGWPVGTPAPLAGSIFWVWGESGMWWYGAEGGKEQAHQVGRDSGRLCHQILIPLPNQAAWHGSLELSVCSNMGTNPRTAIVATSALPGRKQRLPYPEETPVVALEAIGSSSHYFSTTLDIRFQDRAAQLQIYQYLPVRM